MSNKKNRIWLAVMMVLACFLLTACGCKHEETEVINAKSATCTEEGYTGDTQCLNCEKTIAKGEIIPATGHTEGNPTDVAEATCTTEGYTGNVYCITCGEMLTKGEAIAMIAHTPDDVHNAAEATCAEEGYTGDVLCKVCGTMLSQGQTIAKIEHTPDEIHNALAATCSAEGYTGDVLCAVCGEIVEKGEAISALPHTPGEKVNVEEATCAKEGYTGDTYCTVCNALVSQGETVALLPHAWGEKVNFQASTCLLEGYSGDQTCINCGYTEMGTVTERLPHDFVSNTCTVCSWRVAGLYNDGELVFDWQQLLDNGLVTEEKISNGSDMKCLRVSEQLKGTLVINDTVNIIGKYLEGVMLYGYDTFKDCKDITDVYIPSSITVIGRYAFCRSGIEAVHFAGQKIDQLGSKAFSGCKSLKEIIIPEGITSVPERCFEDCINLEMVRIPSTVKSIESGAFKECAALSAIEFPEDLEEIGGFAFSGTSIKEITLPASLINLGDLQGIRTVETIDMSNCQVTELNGAFFYDDSLRVVHLPKTLKSIGRDTFIKTQIETLILPQGFKTISAWPGSAGSLPKLKTIVWPFSFMDEEQYFAKETKPETIYYEGTEAQWNALIGEDAFPNTTIVFDYNYEEGIE